VLSADPGRRIGATDQLSQHGVTSLIALVPSQASVVAAAFVALDAPIRGGEEVAFVVDRGGPQRIVLGEVAAPDALVSFGFADVPGLELPGDIVFHGSERASEAQLRGVPVSLFVGEEEVLRGKRGTWPLVLEPLHGTAYQLRAGASQYAAPNTLPQQGIVSLAFERLSETIEIPVASWSRQPGMPLRSARPFPAAIAIGGGRATMSAPAASR
jgi:hypothetical protein